MTRCHDCGAPSRTEYCEICVPPPAWLRRDEDDRTPSRRWNNQPYAVVTTISDARIPTGYVRR